MWAEPGTADSLFTAYCIEEVNLSAFKKQCRIPEARAKLYRAIPLASLS
jgi:hypothetical protein